MSAQPIRFTLCYGSTFPNRNPFATGFCLGRTSRFTPVDLRAISGKVETGNPSDDGRPIQKAMAAPGQRSHRGYRGKAKGVRLRPR
jgi:hypothetical protein